MADISKQNKQEETEEEKRTGRREGGGAPESMRPGAGTGTGTESVRGGVKTTAAYKCEACGSNFDTRQELDNHNKTMHPGGKGREDVPKTGVGGPSPGVGSPEGTMGSGRI